MLRVRLAPWNRLKPCSKIFLLIVPRRYFFCGSFALSIVKKMVKIRKRHNQVPHLVHDTKWESSKIQLTSPTRFMSCVWHAFAAVPVAFWSPAGKGLTSWLSFLMFYCVFVTFPCGILGQVWYLIVLIPDLCHISYLDICVKNWTADLQSWIWFN